MLFKQMWEAGFTVFPLMGVTDDEGKPLPEKEAYKRPRSSGWQNTPHWSQEQLDFMEESGQFETGFGVSCQGLIVIDVDARNGGVEAFDKLCADIPEVEDAGLVVSTGSGGGSRHLYFRAPDGVALLQHCKEYPGIDFKSSGFVVGAGSLHASGNRYQVIDGNPDDIEEAPAALVDLLRKPDYHRSEYNGGTMDVTESDIADMLSYVDPDCDHETWVRIGMAVHDTTGGTAFNVWDSWSSGGSKYPGAETLEKRWHSFGKAAMPVTIGTLIYYAEQGGWKQSVTFEADMQQFVPAQDPLDTSDIDLLRPPGFVGEVCEWINDQCRYPREHLAVAAALVSVGNVAGLRCTDDLDGATANLFAFGVADSSSGKEAVLQACSRILVEAGISAASHGYQKSQQEVMRNLIRHQAAYYIIDELGIELGKAVNAQKKGSAAYLEGLIGTLMSLYSKADGKALLSGDVKEDVRNAMQRDLAQLTKAIENNEDPTGIKQTKADRLARQLETLDEGLDRPFLSLIGFTTPGTFDKIIDEDQATSGFLGRALLVREHNSNPLPKRPFKKRPMPENMQTRLRGLFFGGYFDAASDRVENPGPLEYIKTTDDAADALNKALDWCIDYAEVQKERTGLEAVVRRGYEMIAKVSLILAAPSGVRTIEHVRWAFALVKRDVDEKLRLVVSNDDTHGADKNLMAKLTKYISSEHGETIGVLKNRLRRYKPADVETALEKMRINGIAEKRAIKHRSNGKTSERWFFVG